MWVQGKIDHRGARAASRRMASLWDTAAQLHAAHILHRKQPIRGIIQADELGCTSEIGMQVITVDIGTGTQDIFLFRPGVAIENGFKLVMPSPTMIMRQRILQATSRQEDLLLTGVTMGGGPCHWAARDHLQAGLRVYATPEAAQTFNDDLEWVREQMGVEIVSEDEAANLDGLTHIDLLDFDYLSLRDALRSFGVEVSPQAVAVAVFDHGAAPPEVSDRQFRFDYLEARIRGEPHLSNFAFLAEDVPPFLTRMQAVAKSAGGLDAPLVLMDTAPAAVLGATFDARVEEGRRQLIANVGNFHALAFRMGPEGIEGVFEHHTGLIDLEKLEHLLHGLANGTLTHEQVFDDHGHGALIFGGEEVPLGPDSEPVIVTGPRRDMLSDSGLPTHFAVPFGDMMLTGCFGLLAAVADRIPETRPAIHAALRGEHASVAPWDAE
jgi:uncharacterized protein (DUF1786 family)